MKNINYVKHETPFYNHLWQKIRTTLFNERHNWKDFFYIISDATANQNKRLWGKQILHVWVHNEDTANIASKVANQLLNDHYSNTAVVISKAEGSDFISSPTTLTCSNNLQGTQNRWRGQAKEMLRATRGLTLLQQLFNKLCKQNDRTIIFWNLFWTSFGDISFLLSNSYVWAF